MIELYVNETQTGLDTNSLGATTAWIQVLGISEMIFYVEGKTGTHATHEVCLEVSPDGVVAGGCYEAEGAEVKIIGEGNKHVHDSFVLNYIRFKVVVAEGAASTVDIHIQGFREKA